MTNFISNETGAVTVDWVVLTAALVGLGLATMAVVSSGVEDLSNDIDGQLKSNDIIVTSFDTSISLAGVDIKSSFAALDLPAWNRYLNENNNAYSQASMQTFQNDRQADLDAALSANDLDAAETALASLAFADRATVEQGYTIAGTSFEENYNAFLDTGGTEVALVYE